MIYSIFFETYTYACVNHSSIDDIALDVKYDNFDANSNVDELTWKAMGSW